MRKKIPIGLKYKLAELPFEEVVFWANFARSKYFAQFEAFMFREAERRKNVIWGLPEANPTVLAIDKAALRGGIETIHAIVSLAKEAGNELERRSEEAKK